MLNYQELENFAKLKRLSLLNTEKDYLQDMILFSIYSIVNKELVFKGGTCLYKIYKIERFSEDLDFTLTGKIDIKKLINQIISSLELINIRGKAKEIREYKNEINIRLLLNGPLYKGNKETQCFIPLNISKKEQVVEIEKHTLFTLYKEIPNFELFSLSEQEILAEKVRAIFTRQKPRDIYDLFFLLQKNIKFNKSLIDTKLTLYNLKFDFNVFVKKIEKMKGLWQIDLKNLIIGELPEFDKVKKEIYEKFKNL